MIGFLDLPSGLSGNMFLGCLVDCGWPVGDLREIIDRLDLPAKAWSLRAEDVHRGSLRATLISVKVHDDGRPRDLEDVRALIEEADLPSVVRTNAVATFRRLARVEATVHGMAVERVHFHEVGALDAIIDIVGVAAGLHALGIDRLYASPVPLGQGWVESAHGRLPLPAPATLALLAEVGAPTVPAPGPGELLTPTGAALLAHYASFRQPPMSLQRIGSGAGHQIMEWPNLARLWLGSAIDSTPMVQVTTNIDDMNPELYDAVSQRLFEAGARDVWLIPIQMKKGRPGVMLCVLVPQAMEQAIADMMLRETTTLGVRVESVRRHETERSVQEVDTAYGPVRVKLKWLGQQLLGASPEYEDCRRQAAIHSVPVRLVYEAAHAAAHAVYMGRSHRTGSDIS